MRYAAFLRGVSPMNLKMPDLAGALEDAGLGNVRTLLSSGNAVFDARRQDPAALERRVERALQARPGRTFATFVRPLDALERIVARAVHPHPAGTRPIVVFLRGAPAARCELPGRPPAWALQEWEGNELWGYCIPGPAGAPLMRWLERRFGTAFTTRTVDTVRKCCAAR